MLHDRVVLFVSPVQSIQLTGLLFLEYLGGSTFRGDVAESLCEVSAIMAFFRSGFKWQKALPVYARVLGNHFMYRMIECAVTAVFAGGPGFCKDAVVFHYLYPVVQQYRFSRFWLTRVMRALGGVLYPTFLRQLAGRGEIDPAVDPEGSFLQHPPYPSRDGDGAAAFAEMPASVSDALRFYRYNYDVNPFYAVFAAGLVPDVAQFVMEQCTWGAYYYQEREKRTSPWRLAKPHLASFAMVAVQTSLSYVSRVTGALLGGLLSNEPTGASIFWWENFVLLAASPFITQASMLAAMKVRSSLEKAHPRTVEDEMEDNREQEEAEEAARAAGLGAGAGPSPFSSGAGAGGAGGGESGAGQFPKGVNYYEVLGVEEKAQTAEIRKAYRQLALKNHPDRVGSDAAAQRAAREQMAVINEAYDTLSNENKRVQYDASRVFDATPDLFKKFDDLSSTKLTVISTAGVVGLVMFTGVASYAQLCAGFHRVTMAGRGPLQLFG